MRLKRDDQWKAIEQCRALSPRTGTATKLSEQFAVCEFRFAMIKWLIMEWDP